MRIECPECSQEFDVSRDFMGKTVECGSCDARFEVSDEQVVAEKQRFYPGEKGETKLEKFRKSVPEGSADVDFQPASYQQNIDPTQIGPLRPRKKVAIFGGIMLFLLVSLVFLFEGGKDGAMRDMETPNRFILCGFVSIIGSALLLYGMSHKGRFGVLLTVILVALLMSMPVFFPGNPVSASANPVVVTEQAPEDGLALSAQARHDYLFEIGYSPIEDALDKYPRESVVGVFLRHADAMVRVRVARYLFNATGRTARGIDYKRGDDGDHGLILLTEQTKGIDEIAALCEEFGRIKLVDKDLRLIDIIVEKAKINSLDKEKIIDPEHPDYEIQNLKALKSYDPDEQRAAVKRLANSRPRALRDDISRQLIKILPGSPADVQLEIINTLKIWALPESGAGPVVLDAVKKLHTQGMVSKQSVELLIDHKIEGFESILMDMWVKDPVLWSSVMIQLGGGAEVLLLPGLMEMDAAHIAAASDILGKVGTKACAEHLEGLLPEVDEQKRKSLQAAIDEIKKRS